MSFKEVKHIFVHKQISILADIFLLEVISSEFQKLYWYDKVQTAAKANTWGIYRETEEEISLMRFLFLGSHFLLLLGE